MVDPIIIQSWNSAFIKMSFVCLQVPLEEGLNKTIQYFSRELEHQANNQYIPKPKAARMKKGRPRHNWSIVFVSGMLGYWWTLDIQLPFYSVGFPPPTYWYIFLKREKKKEFFLWFLRQCFEKRLRQRAVSKEFVFQSNVPQRYPIYILCLALWFVSRLSVI